MNPSVRPAFFAASVAWAVCPSTVEGQRAPEASSWTLVAEAQDAGTAALLQAVSPVDENVAWVSGHRGTYARTTDGGTTWHAAVVAGADSLEFRDVHAFDTLAAVLMSAGPGPLSRIFRTENGGQTWAQVFLMDHPAGFLDCMDFADERRGWVYGDAVDGGLFLLRTEDGGRTWSRVDPSTLPPALQGEGGFAASGTCLEARGDRVVVATGAGPRPRLLRSVDAGSSWTVSDLPLVAGPAAGATSVSIDAQGVGFAFGGPVGDPIPGARVAVTHDGGATWMAGGDPVVEGAIYGAARVPGLEPPTVVAVGPGGIAWSRDGGANWVRSDSLAWWAVGFASSDAGWTVGPGGRVMKLRIEVR